VVWEKHSFWFNRGKDFKLTCFKMTFVTGMLVSLGGFLLIVFRERAKGVTGEIGFAEQYLGSGGTFTFFLLLGVAMFLGGIMWATGTLQNWFYENLGLFFGYT
tara:strand:+ start:249 stop:557 length:309 start_codon:yes stop_codon:yes gene_type:complete